MSAYLSIIYFGSIAAAAIGLSCWATLVALQAPDLPRPQRAAQLVLTWAVPVIGALLVIEIYRSVGRRARSRFVTADEINPIVKQALQPLAQAATRAATEFIEQESTNGVVEHFTHDSGTSTDGSH